MKNTATLSNFVFKALNAEGVVVDGGIDTLFAIICGGIVSGFG